MTDDNAEVPYIFRLSSSMRTIVVHEKVKNHLEEKGFGNLEFDLLETAYILDT